MKVYSIPTSGGFSPLVGIGGKSPAVGDTVSKNQIKFIHLYKNVLMIGIINKF